MVLSRKSYASIFIIIKEGKKSSTIETCLLKCVDLINDLQFAFILRIHIK